MNGSDVCRLSSTRELANDDKDIRGKALIMGGVSYDECDAKTQNDATAAPDRSASSILSALRLRPQPTEPTPIYPPRRQRLTP